jgi:hypothetical protein
MGATDETLIEHNAGGAESEGPPAVLLSQRFPVFDRHGRTCDILVPSPAVTRVSFVPSTASYFSCCNFAEANCAASVAGFSFWMVS